MTGVVRGTALSEGFPWRKIVGALVHIPAPMSAPGLSPENRAWVFVQDGGETLLFDVTDLENRRLVDAAYRALADSGLPAHSANCYMSVLFNESDPDSVFVVADNGEMRGIAAAVISAMEQAGDCDSPDRLSEADDRLAFIADEVVQRVLRDNLLLDEVYHDVVCDNYPRASRVSVRGLPDDVIAVGRFADVLAALDTPGSFRTIAAYASGKKVIGKAFITESFMRNDVGEVFINWAAEILAKEIGEDGKESLVVLVVPAGGESYSMVAFDGPGDADADTLVYKATAISQWRDLSLRAKESYANAIQWQILKEQATQDQ